MSTKAPTPRHQSTGPRHRLGQAPDPHHARAIIHRLRAEGTPMGWGKWRSTGRHRHDD